MRGLVILAVHLYRVFLRQRMQRQCLFKISCSEYVLRAAREKGTWSAFQAFLERRKSCRGDFCIETENGVPFLVSAFGTKVQTDQLTPVVSRELFEAASGATANSQARLCVKINP